MARAPESGKVTDLRKRFGQRVKELRLANSWTQKEVAAKLGVQLSIYTKYEQGRNTPAMDTLIELSEILGTTIDFLLTGNNSDSKPLHTDRLVERLQALESFSNDDKETVIKIIDSLVIKKQVEGMAANPYRSTRKAPN